MKKLITLFVLAILGFNAKAQTDTVTVFYSGYTNQCCPGNSTPYFCFNDIGGGSTTCGSDISFNTQAFMNTVPAGNVVTKVDVYYYTFHCGGGSATANINGMVLSVAPVLNGSCACINDSIGWSISASSSNVYPCGIPGYNYGVGATETFKVDFIGLVCISQARIILTYTNAPAGTTPPITVSASQDSICSGSTVTLTASGASTYTWNTGDTTSTVTVSPINSTMYHVVGTDATGNCINMATQNIYVESINIQASQDIVCGSPTPLTLTASGANTYTWNTSETTNVITTTPTINTTYTVYGTGSMAGCTSLSAIETVTVSSSPIPVTNYTLTPDTIPHYWNAYAGYPSNVTNASWSWGDGTSTLGLYPSHIYSTPGSYNICVTVTVTTGCSASYCQSDSVYRLANNSVYSSTMVGVNVLPPPSNPNTTGINKITKKNKLKIYPNPASTVLNIVVGSSKAESVTVCDVLGNTMNTSLASFKGGMVTIDVSSLPNGVYFIRVGTSTQKFVKQ